MRRLVGVVIAVLAVSFVLPRSALGAMIGTKPHWTSEGFQTELLEVPTKHNNKPCTYITAQLASGGSSQDTCVVATQWGQITDNGYIRFTGEGVFW